VGVTSTRLNAPSVTPARAITGGWRRMLKWRSSVVVSPP